MSIEILILLALISFAVIAGTDLHVGSRKDELYNKDKLRERSDRLKGAIKQ